MIQKIQSSEYLKRMDNMNAAERDEYLNRVGEWLQKQAPLLLRLMNTETAAFQNVIQVSTMWNDAACKAWTDGAQLLTALVHTGDTWLPDMLYTKAAKRCIRQMVKILAEVKSEELREKNEESSAQASPRVVITTSRNNGTTEPRNSGKETKQDLKPETSNLKPDVPVRPKHIDQYVHLLPESTQKKAATVQGLLRDMDVARENMRLLMNDPSAKSDSRAQWAKTVTKLDTKIKAIYKELDAEWDKLVQSGRVVVDDLGNARVANTAATEIKEQKSSLSKEQRERVRTLRSFLKDTRRGNGKTREEHVKKWKEFYKEMVSIAGADSVTDKVKESAEHYGIDIASL